MTAAKVKSTTSTTTRERRDGSLYLKKVEDTPKEKETIKKIQEQIVSKHSHFRDTSKEFCFTFHGSRQKIYNKLIMYCKNEKNLVEAIVAIERGKKFIHPHLQGWLRFEKGIRMYQTLCDIFETKGFYLNPSRGSRYDNYKYILGLNKSYEMGDLLISKGFSLPEDLEKGWISKTIARNELLQIEQKPYPWQKELFRILDEPSDQRTIYWFYDKKGNTGKSMIAKLLCARYGAILTGGRALDMKYAIARFHEIEEFYPKTIICDIARSQIVKNSNMLNHSEVYSGLEQLKNGHFFNSKYESGQSLSIDHIHLIVFANAPPEIDMMSDDRWNVIRINDYDMTWKKVSYKLLKKKQITKKKKI